MARLEDAGTHPVQDALCAGFLSFGEQMIACLGTAPGQAAAPGWWGRIRGWLASLASAPRRHDRAAGLKDRELKDIGIRPRGPSPLSADAATRLSIRANGGF